MPVTIYEQSRAFYCFNIFLGYFKLIFYNTGPCAALAVSVTLLAFAAERRAAAPLLLAGRPAAAAVDRYLLPARRSAANSPHAAVAVEWWDRQTDAGRPTVS